MVNFSRPAYLLIISILTATNSLISLELLFSSKANGQSKISALESQETIPATPNLETNPLEIETPAITSIPRWKKVKLLNTLKGHNAVVDSVVFSTDGRILISGGSYNDPNMMFWSVATGKEIEKIRAQRTGIMAMAMSPDGKVLVSSGDDAGINFWNWPTGEYAATFLDHSYNVLSLIISPDSNVLISGGLDGIRVWDIRVKRPLYTLVGIGSPSYSLAINPNGYILASGNGRGRVRLWNLRTTEIVSEFFPHEQQISGLAFTPDGTKIITSSYDRTIKVWELATGQLLHTLTGHISLVRAIALNRDGVTLASAGNDGVILWNIETGEYLTQLRDHQDWVKSIAFSQDGNLLATGSFDSTIKIWENVISNTEK